MRVKGTRQNETELAERVARADKEALYTLVFDLYRTYLCGVMKKLELSLDHEEVEERLLGFYSYVLRPTVDGLYRFASLNKDNNPRAYVTRSFENYLRDEIEHSRRVTVTENPYNDNMGNSAAADTSELELKRLKEAKIRAMILSLDSIAEFKPLERYILLTYLLGERYRGEGRPLKLKDQLAAQLGLKPSTVDSIYRRAFEKLQAHARMLLEKESE